MTLPHSLERAMDAHLDAHPGDLLTRAELADLLLDLGRDAEAEGQRYLLRERKWPTWRLCTPSGRPAYSEIRPWDWWRVDDPKTFPLHAQIPDRAYYALQERVGSVRYATRLEAEADLIAWARANSWPALTGGDG